MKDRNGVKTERGIWRQRGTAELAQREGRATAQQLNGVWGQGGLCGLGSTITARLWTDGNGPGEEGVSVMQERGRVQEGCP